jgi:hypothetical protein
MESRNDWPFVSQQKPFEQQSTEQKCNPGAAMLFIRSQEEREAPAQHDAVASLSLCQRNVRYGHHGGPGAGKEPI